MRAPNKQLKLVLPCLFAPLVFAQVNTAASFAPSRVRLLDSPFRSAQELHRTGLVGKLDPDRLLFPYRNNAGLPQPPGIESGYGGWDSGFLAGHFAGHYLSAASRMYAATGDGAFRDKADYMVSVLAECQRKLGSGYLSAFPVARFDKLEATPKDGGVEYYTIQKILSGLLDAAEYCGNRQAAEIAAKMSDYFAHRVADLPAERIDALFRTDYAANPHNEFGGMGEALADLYLVARSLGDPAAGRHMKLASIFRREWFVKALVSGGDKLDGIHANTHIPQASALARFAQISGDGLAGRAAESFWSDVTMRHSFANGSHGFNEKFRAAGIEVKGTGEAALGPLTGETCGTYNMLRLTRLLFERAPSVEYGDYYENALYNHILTTIAPDSGFVVYFTPLRPGDFRTYIDQPYCCLGTGIENAARFNEAIYFHAGDVLWVNLYIPSTLDWREQGLKLRLDTRYPESGAVRLAVEAGSPVSAELRLRIPGWVKGKPVLRINGKPMRVQGVPGTFLSVKRTWRSGDLLELNLQFGLRVRRSMDDPSMVSLFHGPVLLAGKLGTEGMPATDIGQNTANSKQAAWPVPGLDSRALENPAFCIRPKPGESLTFTARMLDPADRTARVVEMAPLYRIHHERYAVYWKVLPSRPK